MSDYLTIDGASKTEYRLTAADLAEIDARHQVPDVSTLDPKRSGQAVRLAGLLEHVGAKADALWLTLHATTDDFHASIPLEAVRDRAVLIYGLNGGPLPTKAGGPFRFFIPDFAACHTHEVDECANVKFVDRMELTAERGVDNRPHDGAEHEELHRREAEKGR
jgi:DMSO/TMAO reductase YedYZ molybdopterin-dependent catalytic subunit